MLKLPKWLAWFSFKKKKTPPQAPYTQLTGDTISCSTGLTLGSTSINVPTSGVYSISTQYASVASNQIIGGGVGGGSGTIIFPYGTSVGSTTSIYYDALTGGWTYHEPHHRSRIKGALRVMDITAGTLTNHLHYTLTPEYSIESILLEAIAAEVSDGQA